MPTPEHTRSRDAPYSVRTVGRIAVTLLLVGSSTAVAACGSLAPSYRGEYNENPGLYPKEKYYPEPAQPTAHEVPPHRIPGFSYGRELWPGNMPADVKLSPKTLSEAACRRRYRDSPDVEVNRRGAALIVRNPPVVAFDDRCIKVPEGGFGVYPDPNYDQDAAVLVKPGDLAGVAGVVEDGAPTKDTYGGKDTSTVWLEVVVADGTKNGYPGFAPWGFFGYPQMPQNLFG